MRFAGIDVASQTHVVALVNESGEVLVKPTPFGEDAAGYQKLFAVLGSATEILVVMEATGHYGRNLFAALSEKGFPVALLNPVRTQRFAQEDLARAKTDSIDALSIARFGAQKRPLPTPRIDAATEQLREVVHLYDRMTQDYGDRLRQLHRLVDLCFPEFTRHVRTLDSQRATAILYQYPTAQTLAHAPPRRLAQLCYDGRHIVGKDLAHALIQTATTSVGQHHGPPYITGVQYICQEVDRLRSKLRELGSDINGRIARQTVGSLLVTIHGLGPLSAARIIAAVGDPARFRNAAALAAYVGAVPRTNRSGLYRPHAGLCRSETLAFARLCT